jgi:hypothetical protein
MTQANSAATERKPGRDGLREGGSPEISGSGS